MATDSNGVRSDAFVYLIMVGVTDDVFFWSDAIKHHQTNLTLPEMRPQMSSFSLQGRLFVCLPAFS